MPFKAIIIGGSIAGLTLAHTFTRAGIDYMVLEARDTISPQLGASIIIMPNGARILDQLGVYERMRKEVITGMKRTWTRRGDGGVLVGSNEWPRLVEERLLYECGICERRNFLRSLYEQLEDKSKILLNKKVIAVELGEGGVRVRCEDGSVFEGSIVVGADGIHSRVRKEMQRLAGEMGPKGLMDGDLKSITAEYNCFFGIAQGISGLSPGDSHISVDIDHSSLIFVGSGGIVQWFFFSKLSAKHPYASIPRFTKAQMEAQVIEFGDFHLTDHLTLKEVMKKTTSLSYLPLEEANHSVWTWNRIVCLGDAIHKMTPNLGQGGNQAIESAAVLTNCLVNMLATQKPGKDLGIGEIESSLKRYQNIRQKRSKRFVDLSGALTRNEALATWKNTLRFLYVEPLSAEVMAEIQVELYKTAPYLEFLPLPRRIEGYEVWKEGVERVKANDVVPRASRMRARL